MIQVAHMFYGKEALRKSEIAAQLGKSNQWVGRTLNEARRVGLVKIQIPETLESDLHDKLRAKFPHIKDALIVSVEPTANPMAVRPLPKSPSPFGPRPDAELLKRFAVVAAEYFDRIVDQWGDRPLRVGVTGGETLLEFANAIPDRLREQVQFCPTALVGRGRVMDSAYHVDAVAIATILWARSGRLPNHIHYATVPPYDTKAREGNAIKFIQESLAKIAAMPAIKSVVKEMDAIDVAFAGIGKVNSTGRLTMTCLLRPVIKTEDLLDEGAIADFCYSLIDENGRGRDRWRFFLTAGHYSDHPGLAFFQRMVKTGKKVVAIVGPGKVHAVIATLKAEVFNVLITDSETVKEVLKYA
ncbi:MAG TPA: sugar-binding domain-containing protein [Bryobacteraceae bacterium]|nr:sugar-binding domain-containing protein [Bryobacteraceae bacterium]